MSPFEKPASVEVQHRARAMALMSLLAMAGSSAAPALGADLSSFLEQTSPVLSEVLATRTVAALCNEREPERAEERIPALEVWERANELRVFDALMAGLSNLDDELERQLEAAKQDAREQIVPQLDANPEECAAFDTVDEEPDDLRDAVRALALQAHAIDLSPDPGPIPDIVNVLPVTDFSLRAEEIMALVTPKNALDDDLDDAREAFLEFYLDAWGYVAVYGHIEETGDIREWRGDYQSRYNLECADFANQEQEAQFEAATGRDMIVIGEPRYALVRDEDGTVRLNGCWIFAPEGEIEEADAENPGLMLRPLDVSEAFAGPMGGPQPDEIDRVLYDASFTTRMDGFGNGYVDRREAIYVLLRDGRAFRHDWSFPITDIDLEALERREPEKLFAWRDDWGVVVLETGSGEDIRLEDAIRLVPIGDERRLDDEYYYLQIGMGGGRSDRAYDFAADGQVTYTSGGFVAGNFATSYIIVAGEDDGEQRGRYRFEDYALIVETAQGEERRFFAIGADENPDAPQEVIVEGEVYWLRD